MCFVSVFCRENSLKLRVNDHKQNLERCKPEKRGEFMLWMGSVKRPTKSHYQPKHCSQLCCVGSKTMQLFAYTFSCISLCPFLIVLSNKIPFTRVQIMTKLNKRWIVRYRPWIMYLLHHLIVYLYWFKINLNHIFLFKYLIHVYEKGLKLCSFDILILIIDSVNDRK